MIGNCALFQGAGVFILCHGYDTRAKIGKKFYVMVWDFFLSYFNSILEIIFANNSILLIFFLFP